MVTMNTARFVSDLYDRLALMLLRNRGRIYSSVGPKSLKRPIGEMKSAIPDTNFLLILRSQKKVSQTNLSEYSHRKTLRKMIVS